MNTKDLIIQELEQTPEPLLTEVLDFLRFLKAKQEQEAIETQEDLEALHAAREAIKAEGTISWESIKADVGL